MSIKDAVNHIHNELEKLETAAVNLPEDIYQYALSGIHRDIESLWNHVDNILPRSTLAVGAKLATDAALAQNPPAASNAEPIYYGNIAGVAEAPTNATP